MWEPRPLTTLWATLACYRDSFTFTFLNYSQTEEQYAGNSQQKTTMENAKLGRTYLETLCSTLQLGWDIMTSFLDFSLFCKIHQSGNTHKSSIHNIYACHIKRCLQIIYSYHPRRSARPLHNESVLTFLSINFFHNIPSEMTRYHSLQTSSAAQRESASRYERILSATWSKPFSATYKTSHH
jgi:hypothetical protein